MIIHFETGNRWLMNTDTELKTRGESCVEPLEAAIQKHPFLVGLTQQQLEVLIRNALRVRFEQDETIFREGDPANRFYLIESGKVSLETHVKDGPDLHVQTLGSGEVLGWSWLFPPYYWQFDARAVEATRAIFFYGTRLREQCEQDHELGYELLKRMAAIVISRLQAARKELIACNKGSKRLAVRDYC
jgi:CRP/FNR family transcriptional regulator, cyclic AMP receptor protein